MEWIGIVLNGVVEWVVWDRIWGLVDGVDICVWVGEQLRDRDSNTKATAQIKYPSLVIFRA